MGILFAELELRITNMKRYKFNSIFSIFLLYLIFVGLYGGLSNIGGNVGEYFRDNNVSFLFGYIFVMIILSGIGGVSGDITTYAKIGVLEQLFLGYLPFSISLMISNLINILFQVVLIFIIMFLSMITFSISINLSIMHLIILLLALLQAYGIGLVIGGLAIVFKKITSFVGIFQFILYPLAFAKINEPYVWFLPINPGVRLLKDITANTLNYINLSYFIINSIIYFIIGLIFFDICINFSRKHGTIGIY